MADVERCERQRNGRRCGYALHNGVCPICAGRQVSERLAMPAPLPKAPDTKQKRAKVFVLKRRSA